MSPGRLGADQHPGISLPSFLLAVKAVSDEDTSLAAITTQPSDVARFPLGHTMINGYQTTS